MKGSNAAFALVSLLAGLVGFGTEASAVASLAQIAFFMGLIATLVSVVLDSGRSVAKLKPARRGLQSGRLVAPARSYGA